MKPTRILNLVCVLVMLLLGRASPQVSANRLQDHVGAQKVIMLRVYFHDYAATSRYTKAQVEGFMNLVDTLWQNTSYGTISIDYQVSDLYQLPDNRSAYIDDGADDGVPGTPCDATSVGDLSCGDKYFKVLEDAIDTLPEDLDWTNIGAVLVLMAETNINQFHRGQGGCCWNLPMGPDGAEASVAAAVVSENPGNSDLAVWGRWAHEIGHGFQEDEAPAHPSNYNSEFDLMDSNYPGQTGVFEKQDHTAFPGWLPGTKYQAFTPSCDVGPAPCTGLGGGLSEIWAMEYKQSDRPNDQAVKAYITDNLYYLVSVRRRVLGDELNADFQGGAPGTNGIPDEGVLIERVEEGASQWVTIRGNGTRDQLWHVGDEYSSISDGIYISVEKKIDDDNYDVFIRYNQDYSLRPDVGIYPWKSPPGNTAETTDIWMDSPLNGYGTYRYGTWDDGTGNQVPRGNGDDPAIGQVNRFYARVWNFGGAPASNVVVHFWRNDPPGMGMAGDNGFIELGSVSSAEFPDLANIDAGDFTDVYLNWTPDFAVSAEDMAAGRFNFHTCVRITIDTVTRETVLGNQDGDREQENITYFETGPAPGAPYSAAFYLRNDDLVNKKYFYFTYKSNLPDGWTLDIASGRKGIELSPGEVIALPVRIIPGAPQAVGRTFGADITASSWRMLVSDRNSQDRHPLMEQLGTVRVQTHVLQPTAITCQAESHEPTNKEVRVWGKLTGTAGYVDPQVPFRVAIEGVDGKRNFAPGSLRVLTTGADGSFSGYLVPIEKSGDLREVVCFFVGTMKLSRSASGYRLIVHSRQFLPVIAR